METNQTGWSDAAEVLSETPRPDRTRPTTWWTLRTVLEDAGIPCYLELSEMPDENSPQHRRPIYGGFWCREPQRACDQRSGPRHFQSTILRRLGEANLESLSDEELREMKPEVVFCGLFDRVERVTRAYDEELARRKL